MKAITKDQLYFYASTAADVAAPSIGMPKNQTRQAMAQDLFDYTWKNINVFLSSKSDFENYFNIIVKKISKHTSFGGAYFLICLFLKLLAPLMDQQEIALLYVPLSSKEMNDIKQTFPNFPKKISKITNSNINNVIDCTKKYASNKGYNSSHDWESDWWNNYWRIKP